MSLSDLGKNDISEETQALKDKLASRDTECAGLRTQLIRREADLEELRATLNETIYKLSREAERALQLEEEVSTQSSELKTERISLQNTELALQFTQDRLKAEERAKRELESTLDTVSLHSQTVSTEHQSVQRQKRALESRVRELERIVQTHEARRVSNIPQKSGRPRSSSVSNFRLPAVEQELSDTKAQLHAKETNLRVVEQKLAQAQDNLVKAENARISIDKAGQKRISELLSTLERKEEELELLKETDNAGEREEELLKRIDEDASKIVALEKLVAEGQAARTSQARIQKLQSQLKAECEKVQRGEDLQRRLLHEKEVLTRQHEASRHEVQENNGVLVARERQIEELEAKYALLLAELDGHNCSREPLSLNAEHSSSQLLGSDRNPTFFNNTALADHIQALLHAIARLRNERDGLKRALEFSEVEYRITTEGFQARIASLTQQLSESPHANAAGKAPIDARVRQKMKQLTLCATAFSVVISNMQARLDLSEDSSAITIYLPSSNYQLRDAPAVIDDQTQLLIANAHDVVHQLDVTAKELSISNEECERLRHQLANVEEHVATMVERAVAAEATREEACQNFLLAEKRITALNESYQGIESERNSLAVQITNLQNDLANVQAELIDAHDRYNTLHAQQLSTLSTSEVVQPLRDRIQELEASIAHHTDQISEYKHDIHRLEDNVKIHEERIAEMMPELELLASQKEAMVEDCAEARETRDQAIRRLEVVEEGAERVQQQLQQVKCAHDAELSTMTSVVENLKSEIYRSTAHLADLESENTALNRELDTLGRNHQCLNEQLGGAVSRSRSLELEISQQNAQLQEAIVSLAVIHCVYKDSVQQLRRSRQHSTILGSQLGTLSRELEQKDALVGSLEGEKRQLLQPQSDVPEVIDKSQGTLSMSADLSLELWQDSHDIDFLRNALREKEQQLTTTNQMLEETKCHYSGVESELLERIATMTTDSQARLGQDEDIVSLQVEVENVRIQLESSLQNFADLEELYGEVIQDFTSAKDVFADRLAEIDEQIQTLDADHQRGLLNLDAKYRHDIDVLTCMFEDREREMDELRLKSQDAEAHAHTEENLREELKSYEAQFTLMNDLERDLRRTITDTRQQLTQAEEEILALQEERQSLRMEITSFQAEIQRLMSLTRYMESQIRESEEACMLLKERLQRSELSLTEAEKSGKVAEFNLTLQATQHDKVVTALRREISSLQSGPELRSALTELEEKTREMDDLLRAKCQEIEQYDDRILETLKTNKKLTTKVESLTRKMQALQAKLSSMKNQPQEPVAKITPPNKVFAAPSPPVPAPTIMHAGSPPSSVYTQEGSAPPLTLRPKTPEPRAQSVVGLPSLHTPGKTSELSRHEMSTGKKRPAPDDDERDSVPAEGHYSTDAYLRNGPTPRLRRAHGHPAGFTPVRGASLRKSESSSPGRRLNTGVTPSEIITDVTNSPRGSSRQGDSHLKKKSWLGKIRGGANSQAASSRLGTFGGQ